MTFPKSDVLVAGIRTALSGGDVDFSTITPAVGFVEFGAVDLNVTGFPSTHLAKARVDLANHLGNIPTSVKVDVAGADLDAVLMPGFLREQLTHFGYTRVKADLAAKIDWSEAKKTTTVSGLKLSVKDVGTVTADAVLGGPAKADIEQLDSFAALQSFLPKLSLVSGTLSFKDESIVGRVIADQATGLKVDPDKFRDQFARGLPFMLLPVGTPDFQRKASPVFQDFVRTPGTVTFTAAPAMPIPLPSLISGASGSGMFTVPTLLNLSVSGVPGPKPPAAPAPAPGPTPVPAPAITPTPPPAGGDIRGTLPAPITARPAAISSAIERRSVAAMLPFGGCSGGVACGNSQQFCVAFVVVAAVSANAPARAASAEDAIKTWIAAIPTADWTVTYGRIAYDAPTDRTTLTGLKATSAKMSTTFAFDTIFVGGYAPASDGSFSAASFGANGGSVTSDKAKLADFGILGDRFRQRRHRTDGLRPGPSVHVDGPDLHQHPVGARQARQARLGRVQGRQRRDVVLLFRLHHRQLVERQGRRHGDGGDEHRLHRPGQRQPGAHGARRVRGARHRHRRVPARVRPARYQNGVGDMVWRPAIGLARYHDMTIQSADFDVTLGEWGIENLKTRQPQRPFTQALERVVTSGDKDLTPDGARALFDMYSAFSLGKLSISDVTVDADGGFGSLGAFTMADFSADGLGEISIDNLDVDYIAGFARIGRLAAGDIIFPGMDKLFAAFEASQRDQDVDYADLAAKLGYLEAADVEFETTEVPQTALGKFRLDLKDYVGAVPTNVALDIVGFDAPAELFMDDGSYEMLHSLGYDRVRADYGVKLAWHEADETVSVDGFHLMLGDIGNFTGKAVLGGLSRDALNNVDTLPMALSTLNLVSGTLTIEDKSLLNRYIAQQAYVMGVDQKAFRQELANSVPDMLADIGNAAFQKKVAAALRTYILRPGTLTVSANPPDPLPVTGVFLFASIFPGTLPEILGLDVTAVAGPEPTPYNYVPPADQTPPPSQPDDPARAAEEVLASPR